MDLVSDSQFNTANVYTQATFSIYEYHSTVR